jgi:protein O-mannosyl-transferase
MGKNNYYRSKPIQQQATPKNIQQPVKVPVLSKRNLVLGSVLFLLAFLLYSNTFEHDWVLDDFGVFKDNFFVTKGIDGYSDILTHSYRHGSGNFTDDLYRPVSQLMFATEWELSPDNPGLSHVINVLFYAFNAILLFFVLRKLFKKTNIWIPFAISLLYVVHPIHTEVVANIKSRDEIVSFFFTLLTLLALIKSVEVETISKKIITWILSLVLFTTGMFTKESGVTMLAAIPLIYYFFTEAKWKDYVGTILVLGVGVGIYFMTKSAVLANGLHKGTFTVSIVDNYFYDAELLTGWATAIMLLGKYFLLLVIPHPLACDYSYNQLPLVTFGNIWAIVSLLFYLGITLYAILQIKKKSPIAFGILFFIITMSITSNLLIRFGSSFAERFLFVPSLGFCIAIVFVIIKLFKWDISEKPKWTKNQRMMMISMVGVVSLLFSVKTISRAADWKDQLTLFSKDIETCPNSAHLNLYYALALRDQAKNYEDQNKKVTDPIKFQKNIDLYVNGNKKAIDVLKKAVQIYPKYADAYQQLGLLHDRLGNKLNDKALIDSAEKYYLKSLKYIPTIASLNSNLAKIYFDRKDFQKSKIYFLKSIKYDPLFADGYFNLGSNYGMLGQLDSSLYYYKRCTELDQKRASAYYYIGLTYVHMNNLDSASLMYDYALKLDPYDVTVYILKANLLKIQKKYSEAITLLNKATSFNSFNPDLFILKGQLYVMINEYRKAHDEFSRAIQINPKLELPYREQFNLFQKENQPDSMKKYQQMFYNALQK